MRLLTINLDELDKDGCWGASAALERQLMRFVADRIDEAAGYIQEEADNPKVVFTDTGRKKQWRKAAEYRDVDQRLRRLVRDGWERHP